MSEGGKRSDGGGCSTRRCFFISGHPPTSSKKTSRTICIQSISVHWKTLMMDVNCANWYMIKIDCWAWMLQIDTTWKTKTEKNGRTKMDPLCLSPHLLEKKRKKRERLSRQPPGVLQVWTLDIEQRNPLGWPPAFDFHAIFIQFISQFLRSTERSWQGGGWLVLLSVEGEGNAEEIEGSKLVEIQVVHEEENGPHVNMSQE